MCELVHCVLAYTTSRTNALREREREGVGGWRGERERVRKGVRGRERKGERTSGVAVIARRPAWRQPGKLQARPYFVLSCCFSTRRKEMSEQTRHATPNLLISIHILWLLISSLLHSLSTSFAPFRPLHASPCSLPFHIYISLFYFYLRNSFSSSSAVFFFSPQFASSSPLLLPFLSISFC